MKHINLSSWKGSITDWTKLNYIYGGLEDTYADIANIPGNYAYIENGVYKIEQNYNKTLISDLSWTLGTWSRFRTEISDMFSTTIARSLTVICPDYVTLNNQEPFDSNWDLVIYNGGVATEVLLTNKQYTTVNDFLIAEGNKYITYPLATPQTIIVP